MNMFCFQCEQASRGTGCITAGVCGKTPETAALQDLIIHAVKGIAMYAHRAAQLGARRRDLDVFVTEAIFATVTNVNFDPARLQTILQNAGTALRDAHALYEITARQQHVPVEKLHGPAAWQYIDDRSQLIAQGKVVGIQHRLPLLGSDITGLQELLMSGVKGTAAYADHALILGQEDAAVFAFFHEALDYLTDDRPSSDALLALCLKCGEVNLKVMALLDTAHTNAYGHPVPTPVRIDAVKGQAILVSGHDLKDLEVLLQQTAGTGINIYTHGEMLPAHGYPRLKQYPHLVGNYGGAWQDQKTEFDAFPGAILMTTNCIQEPKESYQGRLFTCGLVAWPGVQHITHRDFTPVIEAARRADGFPADGAGRTITVGFGHHAVLGVADQIIAGVQAGTIKHFFLIGGCDGAKSGRDYYTEFAESVPDDCVILTLACGKYRFNKLHFGTLGGLPRLLDMGQCNDAYSAIQVAVALSKAFNCGVNDLPLSMILSWYEQKAVCILLTLLHLGIKNIHLGPSLPAFATPAMLNVLIEKFHIQPIGTVENDLKACLQVA